MNILVFGGTTEGRLLAERLAAMGHAVTVSVATELGAEELSGIPGLAVLAGRRDGAEICRLVRDFDLCIDATHPYAVEVTKHIRAACGKEGIPLRRLLRAESLVEDCVRVESCTQAAAYLAHQPGNVLVATGAKELAAFAALDPRRVFARVLPTHMGIEACERLGLPHRNILALQGPFTQKLNEAMLEQYHIRWLVTKDGGGAGGFAEKQAAARAAGARLILVDRPPDDGVSLEAILNELGGSLP